MVNYLPANAGDVGLVLGWEDPLEKEMATHSSILAWEIPRTEDLGGLQSMGSQRAGHDLAITQHHSCFTLLCEFLLYNEVISYVYTCPPSGTSLPASHPSRSPQSTKLSSLCYSTGFC